MLDAVINCGGTLLDLSKPRVMAIVNATPDSFYAGSRVGSTAEVVDMVGRHLEAGADIIDIGAMSSRPGAQVLSSAEEIDRLLPAVAAVREAFGEALISIDTVYGATVRAAADLGIHIVNDISAGSIDPSIWTETAAAGLPYVLMHMQGRPETMQDKPEYGDVVLEVATYLRNQVREVRAAGVVDVVIDPGFGFGKTVADNYALLRGLGSLAWVDCPILVGLSRKSMIYKVLDCTPDQALNGSTALHMTALMQGANILRVHDVREAVETIQLYQSLMNQH